MGRPPKISPDQIISAARGLIQEHGTQLLSVDALATSLGVKAPSLYKHFPNKAAILRAVEDSLFLELGDVLSEAMATTKGDRIAAGCNAYRQFAKDHQRLYPLLFTSRPDDEEAIRVRLTAAQPLIKEFSAFGETAALKKARVITAFVHGFVSMELSGAFHLGDGVEQAFEEGVDQLSKTLTSPER
ncbi:MAG: TetR/AcrR family transcriptional regulator [Pseudomonadota bacterium]